MKTDLHLFGATGKVGLELIRLAESNKDIKNIYKYSSKQNAESLVLSKKNQNVAHTLAHNVAIDFSSPKGLDRAIDFCVKNKIALVSGTTGLDKSNFEKMKMASKKIALFWSPNMSVGVATLRKAMKSLAHLQNYDFQIEEIHHRRKKDSPSGTAKLLQTDLENITGLDLPAPVSIRGGGVFGVHKIFAMSEDDVITFEHQALNRAVFARGAMEAAFWLTRQKVGMYSMDDWIK
jgi:4-hydroxy-tetrahydrodipicolinate reductase